MRHQAWDRIGIGILMTLVLAATLYAEDVTITTYYPSPRGVYNSLRTNTLYTRGGDGDINGNGAADIVDSNQIPACATATAAPPESCAFGDIDGNGLFNTLDADALIQIVLGTTTMAAAQPYMKYLANSMFAPYLTGDLEFVGGTTGPNSAGTTNVSFVPGTPWKTGVPGTPAIVFRVGGAATTLPLATLCPAGTVDYGETFANSVTKNCRPTTFIVQPNGNVGIGITNPSAALHVYGHQSIGTFDPFVIFKDYDGGQAAVVRIDSGADSEFRPAAIQFARGGSLKWSLGTYYSGSGGGGYFGVGTDHDSANQKMVVMPNGNVGIGTTVPGAKLHVVGTAAGTNMILDNGAAGDNWLQIKSNGTSKGYIGYLSTGSAGLAFLNSAGSASANMLITDSGDVGIGTTTPTTDIQHTTGGNLDVNDVWVRAANGGQWVSQSMSQHGFFSTSSSSGTVTFPVAFSSIPAVVITVDASTNGPPDNNVIYCSVTSRTITDFSFSCDAPFAKPEGPMHGISWFAAQ